MTFPAAVRRLEMRLGAVVLISLFNAVSLLAGATYDLRTISADGREGLSGHVSIDGPRVRLDVTSGDGVVFRDGSVALSGDGGRTLLILDPAQGRYFQLSIDSLLRELIPPPSGSAGIVGLSVSSPKATIKGLGSGGIIESFPTERHSLDASCDLTISVAGMATKAHVTVHTISWTTTRIDPALSTFVQEKEIRTGIAGLDELLSRMSIPGFPLKEVNTTTIRLGDGSPLTTTETVTVANIRTNRALLPSLFALPAGYKRVDSPLALH